MKQNQLLAILTLAATPAFLHAQTTSYSDIVGYQSSTLVVGLNPVAFPLLNTDILKSSASSASGNSIVVSGQTNIGALITAGEPYYIEVYSGDLKGERFEIDTAATKSAANASVVLSAASPNNTYPVASIAGQLDGQTIALRKHVTLEQVQSFIQGSLVGSNTAASADQILLFNTATQQFLTYYLRADGVTWRGSTTGTVSQNKVSVPPGTGVFIKKNGSTASLVTSGSVRQNDFAQPYVAGLQLQAPGFPLGFSPVALGATAANGWSGNNTAGAADQIQIFNPNTASFATYFLRADGITWRGTTTGTASQNTNNIIGDSVAYFVKKANSNNNNVLINPVQ